MKIRTLLAAALIGCAGYQQAMAVPAMVVHFEQSEWWLRMWIEGYDLPIGNDIYVYLSGERNNGLLDGRDGNGYVRMAVGTDVDPYWFLLAEDINPFTPWLHPGTHQSTLRWWDGAEIQIVTANSYTIATPTTPYGTGYPVSDPVPDSGQSLAMLGLVCAGLFAARKATAVAA